MNGLCAPLLAHGGQFVLGISVHWSRAAFEAEGGLARSV